MHSVDFGLRKQLNSDTRLGGPVLFGRSHPVPPINGQVVLDGGVAEFVSLDRRHIYAWPIKGNAGPEFFAMVGSESIQSPVEATRAWAESGQLLLMQPAPSSQQAPPPSAGTIAAERLG